MSQMQPQGVAFAAAAFQGGVADTCAAVQCASALLRAVADHRCMDRDHAGCIMVQQLPRALAQARTPARFSCYTVLFNCYLPPAVLLMRAEAPVTRRAAM